MKHQPILHLFETVLYLLLPALLVAVDVRPDLDKYVSHASTYI